MFLNRLSVAFLIDCSVEIYGRNKGFLGTDRWPIWFLGWYVVIFYRSFLGVCLQRAG